MQYKMILKELYSVMKIKIYLKAIYALILTYYYIQFEKDHKEN